jgi:hypothetical protein
VAALNVCATPINGAGQYTTLADVTKGGRGLYLVDQIATRWGSRPTRDSQAVWFEIPIDGQAGLPR